MLPPENLYRVVCRPALPCDTADVMELTRKIWEGQDYIPEVWTEWLNDPEGLLAVAEFGGKVVGISKLTRLSDQQWWLEGLRVHPSYEGRGIASRLHDYLLDIWEKIGSGSIRLVTASFRKPVHHLARRTGFHNVCELTLYAAESDFAPIYDVFHPPEEDEISQAIEFIKKSATYDLTKGLIDLGWQWASLEPGFLSDAVQKNQVWWWRDRWGLLVIRDDEEGEVKSGLIQLIACSERNVAQCLFEFKWLGKELGFSRVGWTVPINPILIGYLEQAGYKREWDMSLYLFEKTQRVQSN